MLKVISMICGISVIALGLIEMGLTFAGIVFPRTLTYVFGVLCIINALFLMKHVKGKG